MNNKILVILLSLTLSYTVNANNENVQDTESIGYNRAQLREQIATAWQSIQPDTVLNEDNPSPISLPPCTTRCHLSTTSNPCSCERLEKKSHQDKYIVISFTPIVFNSNTPHVQSNIFDFANLEGKIALKTEFLQDVEFGLGLRRGALRFEGGLRYTRLHVNGDIKIEDIDVYHDPVSIWDLFDQIDKLEYHLTDFPRETIDTLGPVAGIAYDIGRFYIGGKAGLVRASVGNILSEVNDWTSFYQVNFGITEELTDNLDFQAGYDYSRFNETRFVSDSAATSLAPIKRHGVHFRFLVSFGE